MNRLTDPEAWEAWKSHPLTQEWFKFLKDRRTDLMEAWGSGNLMQEQDQAQAFTLKHLTDLSAGDVRRFYGINDEANDGDAVED